MARRPVTCGAGLLSLCSLVTLLFFFLGPAVASPQKPGVAIDQGIIILPVDPCELLSNRRTGGLQVEGIDQSSLQILALGCLSRTKRAAPDPPSAELPKARGTRGLFKIAHRSQGGLIYPGTKWCGPGSVARSYWDLGKLAAEDRCCREHDHCPESIAPGRCSHGLCNPAPFTRSHCECEERFRRCLQTLKTPAADSIGAIYFNVGNLLCFAEDGEENDLLPNMGGADVLLLEDRSGMDLETADPWKLVGSNGDSYGGIQQMGCSGRSDCRYKFYAQKPYTEAAKVRNFIPTVVQRPRMYPIEGIPQQHNFVVDKRSGTEDADQQAAEFLSKFFHHVLRSTGILRPRK